MLFVVLGHLVSHLPSVVKENRILTKLLNYLGDSIQLPIKVRNSFIAKQNPHG